MRTTGAVLFLLVMAVRIVCYGLMRTGQKLLPYGGVAVFTVMPIVAAGCRLIFAVKVYRDFFGLVLKICPLRFVSAVADRCQGSTLLKGRTICVESRQ